MLKRVVKNYPFHTFIIIPFILLFLYSYNINQVYPFMLVFPMILGLIISVIFLFLFYLFYRNIQKSGLFASLLILLLFNYGVIYDFLEKLYSMDVWPFVNIHRYLVGFYIFIILLIFVLVFITKRNLSNLTVFLNITFSILFMFNLLDVIQVKSKSIENTNFDFYQTHEKGLKKAKNDIFFIILDGYANDHILSQYYDFKDNELTSYLKKNDFFVSDSSNTIYYNTSQSLSSTLNMNYLNDKMLLNANHSNLIFDNILFKELKAFGYQIIQLKSGYAVSTSFKLSDQIIQIDSPNEFERGLLKYTILRLDDLFGYLISYRLKSQFIKLDEIAKIKTTPKFVFIHIVAPHPPFVFDKNGNKILKTKFEENSWEPKELYIGQLQYVNKKTIEFIDKIKVNKDATIIIQSDHGPWLSNPSSDVVFKSRSRILNAIRIANGSSLPQNFPNVNTFRYVLNQLHNIKFDTLNTFYPEEKNLRASVLFKNKIH